LVRHQLANAFVPLFFTQMASLRNKSFRELPDIRKIFFPRRCISQQFQGIGYENEYLFIPSFENWPRTGTLYL
jgi:hypothetical protein